MRNRGVLAGRCQKNVLPGMNFASAVSSLNVINFNSYEGRVYEIQRNKLIATTSAITAKMINI